MLGRSCSEKALLSLGRTKVTGGVQDDRGAVADVAMTLPVVAKQITLATSQCTSLRLDGIRTDAPVIYIELTG